VGKEEGKEKIENPGCLYYNIITMSETETINNVHDKLFHQVFKNPVNTGEFLSIILPETLLCRIDLSKLEIDDTRYITKKFEDLFSDLVFKTKMTAKSGGGRKRRIKIDADIYIILEHKSSQEPAILIQLLWYMLMVWEKDLAEKKSPRVIIPVVFYHGKKKWNIPRSFIDQFDVDDEVKEFLLNYRYILFDTRDWDFHDAKNEGFRDNVFLLTALSLMKSAFNKDIGTIAEIFRFWCEKGFTKEKDKVLFFLTYISETKDIDQGKLKKILEETKIDGGDLMQTLAQRLRQEGKQEGMQLGKQEARIETAKQMLLDKMSVKVVAKYTGLSEKELKKLLH
jgi:predicted transposase/invertase (TIGR01784 family)